MFRDFFNDSSCALASIVVAYEDFRWCWKTDGLGQNQEQPPQRFRPMKGRNADADDGLLRQSHCSPQPYSAIHAAGLVPVEHDTVRVDVCLGKFTGEAGGAVGRRAPGAGNDERGSRGGGHSARTGAVEPWWRIEDDRVKAILHLLQEVSKGCARQQVLRIGRHRTGLEQGEGNQHLVSYERIFGWAPGKDGGKPLAVAGAEQFVLAGVLQMGVNQQSAPSELGKDDRQIRCDETTPGPALCAKNRHGLPLRRRAKPEERQLFPQLVHLLDGRVDG